jgi:hypothetical protein
MKRKDQKKLKLNIETLRHLDLERVSGGASWWSCPETRGFTNCEYCGPTGAVNCTEAP